MVSIHTIGRLTLTWLLLLAGGAMLTVAAQDSFNPDNPLEPYARFRVTVTSDHGYTSGAGTYQSGSVATVSTSARSQDYTFAYWTLNGVKIDEPQKFSYTVKDRNVHFVAVYDFTPVDPAEPQMPDTYRLYLTAADANSCSFNRTSGDKAKAGNYVELTVNPSPGYVFKGWFIDGQKESDQLSFGYCMPAHNVTLEARLVYNPTSPDEPNGDGSQGGNISKNAIGDVNGDGKVDTADAVLIINHYVAGTADKLNKGTADVSGDGKVDTADAVSLINKYVNGK